MIITRAPVRISFGGGGTDLAAYYARYGGLVVSAAIARYAYVVVCKPPAGGIRISSADFHLSQCFAHDQLPAVDEPLALPKAAVSWFAPYGLRERGADLLLTAEIPPGTGLGSSSTMAAALVQALGAYVNMPLDPARTAEIACELEIERLGMPIGKQDQYAAAFGGLNLFDFRADGVRVEPLALAPDVLAALGERLLLFDTGRTRAAASILRGQRTASEHDLAVIAALHTVKALAADMHEALVTADLDRFGRLLDRGWREKKRLAAGITTPEIDRWYAAAREAGALGGKITGAGGGGFLLLYCPPRRQPAVRAAMTASGLRELPFQFDLQGASLLSWGQSEVPVPPPLTHLDRVPVSLGGDHDAG